MAVEQHLEQGVLTLQLHRPDKKNALTRAMYSTLASALDAAQDNPEVRVILLTGGSQCFTSGNDLQDFLQGGALAEDSPVFHFMRALFDSGKPVVAAVAGPAVGIGTTLLLHCDLVYVSADAYLQMPFVTLGLCPEYGSSLILPRLLGMQRANALLLLGEAFSGEQAAVWGLANAALADGRQTLAHARQQALRLAEQPAQALALSRQLLRAEQREALRARIHEEGRLFAERLQSAEARAALLAFLQRRKQAVSC